MRHELEELSGRALPQTPATATPVANGQGHVEPGAPPAKPDLSSLFMSMLKCMQTTDLELKKLVYLYLINCESELVVTRLPGVLA